MKKKLYSQVNLNINNLGKSNCLSCYNLVSQNSSVTSGKFTNSGSTSNTQPICIGVVQIINHVTSELSILEKQVNHNLCDDDNTPQSILATIQKGFASILDELDSSIYGMNLCSVCMMSIDNLKEDVIAHYEYFAIDLIKNFKDNNPVSHSLH